MKKIVCMLIAVFMLLSLAACGGNDTPSTGKTYKVGICNFVDDASLNQIVDNIRTQLEAIGKEKDVTFQISYDNCNMNAQTLDQIITNFMVDQVDLMVGVATPVAMAMQGKTDSIPVVFAAVSDPLGAELVASPEAPGANITGTSDYLDTEAIMNLIFALKPEASKIGLLYDMGQDSSTAAINDAKAFLESKNIEYVESTVINAGEVRQAAESLVADKVDAVFTPSDNTIMSAQMSIYEVFSKAGIPQFTGADSFALNGAFLGYGVDYANLGKETANMVAEILLEGKNPGEVPVKTFDNGTATVNTETCTALGLDYDTVAATFAPFCTKVSPITTANSFDELK